jgi:dCMP deaminase
MPKSWTEFYLEMVELVATKSKDTSKKVGCVIVDPLHRVLSIGYNGMPRNVNDDVPERHERPVKYHWFEHAERNAIYNANGIGAKLKGSTMYLQSSPCSDCARAIIQNEITHVVAKKENIFTGSDWEESIKYGKEMLKEAGVKVIEIESKSQVRRIGRQMELEDG